MQWSNILGLVSWSPPTLIWKATMIYLGFSVSAFRLNLQSKLVLWGKAMVSSTEPVARVCKDLAHFRADYTGLITDLAHRKFSPVEWKSIYSFNVFDVSKQSKRLKTSTLDIRIKTRFKQNSGAPNINFFCLPLLGFSNI